jgi:hypothetical protein
MRLLLCIVLLFCFSSAHAQFTQSVSLKPIQINGGKYYYGLKKVKDAYSLEVPLGELADKEIDRQYRGFKNLNSAASWINVVPLVYIFYVAGNSSRSNPGRINVTTFWSVWGGTLLTSIGLRIAAKVKVKKAMDRYNELIFTPETGSLYYASPPLGMRLTYRF